jgi:hypothetical protein
MIKFDEYILMRKLDAAITIYAENQGITVDQAKQQIVALFDQIVGTDQTSLTAKLTFMNDLLTKGAQALPELQNKYKTEYPKLQQMQGGQQPTATPQQPQQPQQQPNNLK